MNPVKSILNTLNVLFLAIFVTLMISGGVVAYLVNEAAVQPTPVLKNLFNLLVPVVLLGAIVIANVITKKRLEAIEPNLPLPEKLKSYQAVLIIRCAALEMAGTLASVASLVTGELYFLIAVLGAAVLFFTIRPSASVITNDLSLSPEEKIQLQS